MTKDETQKIVDKVFKDGELERLYYEKLENLIINSISSDGLVQARFNGMLDLVEIKTSSGFTNISIIDAFNDGLLRAIHESYELRDLLKFEPEDLLLEISRHKENSRRRSQL